MAKTPRNKKNSRRLLAGLPPPAGRTRSRQTGPPVVPFDVDHFVLTTMAKLHAAGHPQLRDKLPAGWTPPQAVCKCGVSGPYHTADRRWTGSVWESVCPGCGETLTAPLPATTTTNED